MGTSTTWAQLGEKYARLAADYADLPQAQIREGVVIVKKSVDVFMPGRLRGVGKRGATLTVIGLASGETGRVFVRGPAQFIENDTKAHAIPRFTGSRASKKTGLTKLYGPAFGQDKNQKTLTIGGNFRVRVFHPGTKGKHPWAKGVEASLPVLHRLLEVKADLALRRIF